MQRLGVVAEHDRAGPAGLRVAVPHHPAQLLQVDARRLGQLLRLARRGEADERQHVARQLHPGSRARLAGMDHQRRPLLEHRLDPFVRLVVGADHDGQLALVGRAGATADRSVDDVDPLGLQLLGQLRSGVVGSIVEWIAMTVPGLACAAELADHLAHLLVVEHGDADDVGGGDIGDAVGQRGAEFGQRGHRLGAHVEDRQPAGPLDQSLGHRRALVAQPDVPELSTSLMSAALRSSRERSSDDLSAVDVEDLAGDPLGLIRQQEQAHPDQVLGLRPCATTECP